LNPSNLSAYADPILDELLSGEPKIDNTFFLNILESIRGSILELGCGYGRITIPLAQRGITNLTGLELSAPSLAYARIKAGNLPIEWVEADVRSFQLGQKYPFIFARGNVFDFMLTRSDQEAMLSRVREHLDVNGQFMFDYNYYPPNRMINVLEEVEWFQITHPNGRQIFLSGTDEFDHSQQYHIQTCYERWDRPDGELVRPPWQLTLRYFMSQEIDSLLHYNGFKVVSKYADYDGSLETFDKPARVLICQKRM
jgi:SAM-dependent methyltransferase